MDDLAGMDWSTPTSSNANQKKPPMNSSSAFASFPSLQPTPSPVNSGRNTPLSSHVSGAGSKAIATAPTKPAHHDAFSNLMATSAAKSTAKLSLAERQKQLEAEKLKKLQEKKQQQSAAYGDGQFWDTLGQGSSSGTASRTASPALRAPGINASVQNVPSASDDDLFAAFNKDTKVDNASHYPPPASGKSTPAPDLRNPSAWSQPATTSNGNNGGLALDDDDDPFGLNQFQAKPAPASAPAPAPPSNDDELDDLLGDLGRPVDEVRKKQEAQKRKAPQKQEPEPGKPIEDDSSSSDEEAPRQQQGNSQGRAQGRPQGSDPFDKAVAQIMEMGFTAEDAARGLTESGQGLNVQAAISYLLSDAHQKAREKTQRGTSAGVSADRSSSRARNGSPAWASEERPGRRDNRSPAAADADLAKTAAAVGSSLLKSANKFWSVGQKKVQKAMAEFQEGPADPNQPKWMRSAQQDLTGGREGRARPSEVTDEAMLLDSGARPDRQPRRPAQPSRPEPRRDASRDQSPALAAGSSRSTSVPKWQQNQQTSFSDPKSRLNKQAIEEQGSQAYVSPARRKKTTPQPPSEPKPFREEPDLFLSQALSRTLPARSQQPSPRPPASQPPRKAPTPRPARQIPPLEPSALQLSTRHRSDGTAHFKRGDYASAHASYSSSLSAIPQTHPLAIVILCNRALTALKTGEPRQAVTDADAALELIGPGKGEGENVPLQDETGDKRDMKDLYGKALTRKAEALEQMERWAEAGQVWQSCVESGVGGPTATAGRQRCQKALAPKPKDTPKPAASRPPPRPRPTAPAKDSEAVARLQESNKAAEAADAEKFALSDQVDARIAAWRDGKRENLRALLASLDQVLWEGSGWKKVGLHELVMANRVKVVYMKAIAKTHPDKLAQGASVEARMIAATVFSTLNESWDKFKAENGL
ncbi:UBA/TS-N domain-containing protein [Diaporthe helianthi]|uniref:UBA/TS-N domain-containing protein n=1 Tax=Diaporthe helianthi TaxID=158607 RepID=A0A2P5IAE2_DIAHE|nr:UBA/TS-N domain-containing protein [Diaporthe helianthi]